jgi:hypothetical protein
MPPTVCWFVQSHRDPEQILRLVRTLRRGSSGPIVLRHDDPVQPLDPTLFEGISDFHCLPASGRQLRGTFSCQTQPYLDLIAWLENRRVAYDWLVNLTAQDYPVTPVHRIEAFLGGSQADGFVRWWDVFSTTSPWSKRKARARYWHRFHRWPDGSERLLSTLRWITRITPLHFYLDYGPLVGVRLLRTPFTGELRCLGGRSWWTLRRSAVLYLREFLAARPDVERHYRGTVAPEESLFQTILVGSRRFALVNDDLRYVDYSAAVRGSPRTLTTDDLPLLASGSYHFARKFDLSVDRAVLDRIDRELLGLEPA